MIPTKDNSHIIMTSANIAERYWENVNFIVEGESVGVECKKGLWSVFGHLDMLQEVTEESFNYFMQYLEDGEYDAKS